jgi:single-strand DNA-binding protein
MRDVNVTILSGNLTRDPEVKDTPNGHKVATFVIAVGNDYKDKTTGEWKQDTQFIPCEAWSSGAESMERQLHKGDKVLVEGSWAVEQWKDKEDNPKRRDKLRVERFSKLSSPKAKTTEDAAQQGKQESASNAPAGNGSDIPF